MRIVLNEDKKLVEDIRQKIADNDGYCLTAKEKCPETRCICKAFLDNQIVGYCSCKLYKKVEL